MIINRSYKVELKPNNVQKTFLNKSIGIARLAYNWGLDLSIKRHEQGLSYLGAIADSALFEIKRLLEYKTTFYGGEVYVIDRWFPSSKMCSNCGSINDNLTLSDRIYNCDCGLSIDRDFNASINIKNYYLLNCS